MTISSMARFGCLLVLLVLLPFQRASLAQDTDSKLLTPAHTITLSKAVLKWEPIGSLPPTTEYKSPAEPMPPYVLTLTARVEHTDDHNILGGVTLIGPNGERLEGTALRGFVGESGERKWMWNGPYGPDPRWGEWNFEFDTASEVGTLTSIVDARKEPVQWDDIPVDGVAGSEAVLGRALTEKKTVLGSLVWIESVKVGDKGTSVRVFGRWLPPENDPAMRYKIEVTRDRRADTAGVTFDVGEAGCIPMVVNGREDGHADDSPGWFTLSLSRPEGAKRLSLQVRFDPSSPLKPSLRAAREKISLRVAPPARPPAIATDAKPIAVQPLGKGELQLFSTELKPENGWKWAWRAPLFLVMPPGESDGTQWQDTGEVFANVSTGMRRRPSWKMDGSPLALGEVARDGYSAWSEAPGKTPPTQGDFTTTWQRVKNETFSPHFAAIPIPAPGVTLTPNTSQPLGEWGTLVLKKVASFGPDETLSPRMKERALKMFPMGGVALVFEQVPAEGKTDRWDWLTNSPNWKIDIDEAHDSNKYPLERVSDIADGRHLPQRDELTTADTKPEDERRVTIYVLPPTPGAKTFDLTLQVRHRAVLENQKITFPAVTLPAQ